MPYSTKDTGPISGETGFVPGLEQQWFWLPSPRPRSHSSAHIVQQRGATSRQRRLHRQTVSSGPAPEEGTASSPETTAVETCLSIIQESRRRNPRSSSEGAKWTSRQGPKAKGRRPSMSIPKMIPERSLLWRSG